MKKFLALIVLIGFIGGAFFSISAMNHSQGLLADGDCSASSLHTGVCPIGDSSVASHYISMYQAFTNGLVASMVTQVLMIATLLLLVVYVFSKHLASIRCLILSLFILSRNFVAKLYRPQTLTRWLSLLVNSPSFN